MKIRLLKCVAIKGQPTEPGAVVDVPQSDAASLIRRGMAETVNGDEAPADPSMFLDATADAPEEPKRKTRR
jgi:hypothetical protein